MSKYLNVIVATGLTLGTMSAQAPAPNDLISQGRTSLKIREQRPRTLFEVWGKLAGVTVRFSPAYDREQPFQTASIEIENQYLPDILNDIAKATNSCVGHVSPTEILVEVCRQETIPANRPDPMTPPPLVSRMIVVGAPKVYDDLYLQNQLTALQNQLVATHVVDQTTLLNHIGGVQGLDQSQISVAASASGLPTAGTTTFALPPGVPAFSYPPGYQPSTTQTAFPSGVATAQTPGTTTTMGSITPAAPTAPAPTLTPPTVNGSSLSTYNESLQLSFEILNTQLLLGGAISDHLQTDGLPKTTFTLGFPITITPPSRGDAADLKNAVAEVEVSVCPQSTRESPSIMTLLPQERTYNVASLVDKSFLGSVGAILGGLVNVGGAFFWGHKTYYLVQQQETVAMMRPPSSCGPNANAVSFAWQIRPVLGQTFLRPGQSVNFVQVSIPDAIDDGSPTQKIAEACVSVHWRAGDKKGIYLGDTLSPQGPQCYPVSYYSTTRPPVTVAVNDISQGNVHVNITGTFLPGSLVRIGSQLVTPTRATANDILSFDVSAKAIVAAHKIYLVGRDKRETEIIADLPGDGPTLMIKTLETTPFADKLTKVVVTGTFPLPTNPGVGPSWHASTPLVMIIGGNVFGLSDAPFFEASETAITALVPTDLIRSSPAVEVRRLLSAEDRSVKPIPVESFAKNGPSISKTTIVSAQNGLILALTGSGLKNLRLEYPSCQYCSITSSGDTFATVFLNKSDPNNLNPTTAATRNPKSGTTPPDPTAGLKQILVCRLAGAPASDMANARPSPTSCDPTFPVIAVDIPKLEGQAPKPSLDPHDPLPINTAEVTVKGTLLDQVVLIQDGRQPIAFRISADKVPTLTMRLPATVAAVPGGHTLLITFADKTTAPYTLVVQDANK